MPEVKNQEKLIEQLRESILDLLPKLHGFRTSDWYLWKFLKEHHLNVKASAEALRSAMQWKSQLKLDFVEDKKENVEMKRKFPYENDAFDKNGHPVLVVPFGRWKIRESVEMGQKNSFLRHAFQMTEVNQERFKDAFETSHGEIDGVIIIFDLKGYSIRELMHRQTIATLSEWTRKSEQLYPQQLKTFYVINANWVMPILFSLLKPFMSRNTVDRVKIFDSNKLEWQRELSQNISGDQLSAEYGGTKKVNNFKELRLVY